MTQQWNHVQAKFLAGQLDRRQLLTTAAVLGVSGRLVQAALAQAPKRGGHLILGIDQGSSTDSLDPAAWNSAYMLCFGPQLYDTLSVVDERVAVKPALAESWAPKAGVKEWVFKLRKGVTFHNGKSLTSADVVYSINHHRGKDSRSGAKAVVASIADIKATAPDEVTITLDGGNVDLPYLMSDWHLGIVPEGSRFDGMGTGPFVLESFKPGVRARTKRNTNDWRSDRGYVDSVESIVINDNTAKVTALLSGNVHMINRIPSNVVDVIEKNPQLKVVNAPGGTHGAMAMLSDTAPCDNLDLRLALKYATDRETILKTVLHGYGKLGNDQPIPSYDPVFAANIPQRTYDPDQAKFHYKKSGHSGPLAYTTADGTFTSALEVAQVFQASAAKTGIDIQLNRVPNDGYYANYWSKVPFFATLWTGRPTADMLLTAAYSSTSALNESHWKNPKFDQVLVAARSELDAAKRKQMYHDLQLMVRDEAATVIPFFNNTIDGASRRIQGFVPTPVGQMSGYRAAEMVWFGDA
jgi:peptide/nickel transport system substrate-binding protein